MNKFRVHHILCTSLYQGKGYDGKFCANMTAIVESLRRNPSQQLQLVTKPDMICANCPNLLPGDRCADEDDHVRKKDQALLEPLHLIENEIYSYEALLQHQRAYLTEEIFCESCQNCRWFKEGLCDYEKLLANCAFSNV